MLHFSTFLCLWTADMRPSGMECKGHSENLSSDYTDWLLQDASKCIVLFHNSIVSEMQDSWLVHAIIPWGYMAGSCLRQKGISSERQLLNITSNPQMSNRLALLLQLDSGPNILRHCKLAISQKGGLGGRDWISWLLEILALQSSAKDWTPKLSITNIIAAKTLQSFQSNSK